MLKNQCLTFLIKESMCLIMKICNLLEARVKTKRNTLHTRIQSITMVKTIYLIQHTKKNRNGDKDGKALYKLMNNAVYIKTMENLRNRIDVRLVSNKKNYSKWTSKSRYMSHKIFDQ